MFLFKNEPSCTCATVQKYFTPQTVPYPEIFWEYQFQLETLEQDPQRTNFTPCSSVSIVKFEHVNADWIIVNFEE